jgi:hypothetical protein
MLAHISKSRPNTGNPNKGWDSDWSRIEPNLNQTILEFLGRLSTRDRDTCVQWIIKWLNGNYQGKDVLKEFAGLVKPAEADF